MNRRREPFFITLVNSIFSFSDAFTEIVYVCFGGDAKRNHQWENISHFSRSTMMNEMENSMPFTIRKRSNKKNSFLCPQKKSRTVIHHLLSVAGETNFPDQTFTDINFPPLLCFIRQRSLDQRSDSFFSGQVFNFMLNKFERKIAFDSDIFCDENTNEAFAGNFSSLGRFHQSSYADFSLLKVNQSESLKETFESSSLNPSSLIILQNSHNENVNNFRKLFYEKVSPTRNKTRNNPSKTNRKITDKITGEWGLIKNLQTDSIGRNSLSIRIKSRRDKRTLQPFTLFALLAKCLLLWIIMIFKFIQRRDCVEEKLFRLLFSPSSSFVLLISSRSHQPLHEIL